MIVVSLLLILVAVALLVLGLAGGTSTLLISSIVASLLAAVFLVIGARQAATRRRGAAPAGIPPTFDEDPFIADAPGPAEFAGDPPGPGADVAGDPITGRPGPGSARRVRTEGDPAPDPAHVPEYDEPDLERAASADQPDGDMTDGDMPDDDQAPGRDRAPDYDRAASVIGAARTAEGADESWRRDPDADAPAPDPFAPAPDPFVPAPDDRAAADPFAPASDDDADAPGDRGRGSRVADEPSAGATAPPEEFAEPDVDDPADEPLPQAVRPGDAVRVARMDAEVLVVDGRPRYHVADCPHLVGRLTEPLPANEAVELGFSPCGLCRPVDRLVAQAAHR